jgi:hypothetical protein
LRRSGRKEKGGEAEARKSPSPPHWNEEWVPSVRNHTCLSLFVWLVAYGWC